MEPAKALTTKQMLDARRRAIVARVRRMDAASVANVELYLAKVEVRRAAKATKRKGKA